MSGKLWCGGSAKVFGVLIVLKVLIDEPTLSGALKQRQQSVVSGKTLDLGDSTSFCFQTLFLLFTCVRCFALLGCTCC